MIDLPVPLILASGSPRRSELLASVGLSFDIRPADIDESIRPDERPEQYVARLAVEKAATVGDPDVIVIAADTTVELDGTVFGKPADSDDAARMLRALAGRTHHVHTGLTVMYGSTIVERLVTTAVTFVPLDQAAIDWYVGTGEPDDKAGAYAIQGSGAALVAGVEGSVSNVIGLPLAETIDALRRFAG